MPFVYDITMATPDMVCVWVRDEPIQWGGIVALGSPDAGAFATWLARTNPATGLSDKATVIGASKTHLRFQDVRSTTYLSRAAADVAANYGTIGGRTVTAVYRDTKPYMSGLCAGTVDVFFTAATSSQHWIYLKLSGNLAAGGPYTITFPAGTGLPPASFSFNDKNIRAHGIRASQIGCRPGDVTKLAYFGLWVPNYPNEGAIDLKTTYGISTFKIIDATGTVVYDPGPNSITLRMGPTTAEVNTGFFSNNITSGYSSADGLTRISSLNTPTLSISAMTNANPCQATTTAPHGLTSGNTIRFYNVNAFANGTLTNATCTVTVISPTIITLQDTFGANIDTTAGAAYTSGGIIFKTININRTGTYVFGADFSGLRASDLVGSNPPYRVWFPGVGTSDSFPISERAYLDAASYSAAGEYHHRVGMALDGRFGYTRPSCFKGGSDLTMFVSKMCYAVSALSGMTSFPISGTTGAASPWIMANTTVGTLSWMDAGDYVTRVNEIGNSCYLFLDLIKQIPIAAKATAFNIPKSSVCIGGIYDASTDVLPDLVHQAIWGLDGYRATQAEAGGLFGTGAVYSGLQMDTDTGTNILEPSYLFRGVAYQCAPDTPSNYSFAGAAAKLSTVLTSLGFPSLASTWLSAAQDAWNWADPINTTLSPVVVAGGTGYAVNDTYVVSGGTSTLKMILQVTAIGAGGSVTAAKVIDWGTYSVNPSDPVSQFSTSGVGSGATFNAHKGGAGETYYNTTLGSQANALVSPTITASIAGTTLTVTAISPPTAPMGIGQRIYGPGITAGTYILQQLTGAAGDVGTYQVSVSQTVASQNITASWTNANFATVINQILVNTLAPRVFAAGCLFTATSLVAANSTYDVAVSGTEDPIGGQGSGMWEYAQSAFANATKKANILNATTNRADSNLVAYNQGSIAYRNLQFKLLTNFFLGTQGTDVQDIAPNLIRAHIIAGGASAPTSKYLDVLQTGIAFIMGANQSGQTNTAQVGARWRQNFNADTEAMGFDTPKGISCYGFMPVGFAIGNVFNFGSGFLSFVVENPDISLEPDFEFERTETPESRYCRPVYESVHDVYYMLGETERSVQQTVLPLQAALIYLSGFDGNSPNPPLSSATLIPQASM